MSASGPGGGTATDLAALLRATPDSAGELERLTSLLDQAFLQAIG
jgi:hypothetical protein